MQIRPLFSKHTSKTILCSGLLTLSLLGCSDGLSNIIDHDGGTAGAAGAAGTAGTAGTPISPKPTTDSGAASAIELAIEAIGGNKAIEQALLLELKVEGRFFEPHQAGADLDQSNDVAAEFSYTQLADLEKEQYKINWAQSFIYPFGYNGESVTTIHGGQGTISGVDGFGSRYFGMNAPRPIDSARAAAISKTQLLENPLWLLKLAKEKGDHAQIDQAEGLPSIALYFDETSHLPSRSVILESDALLGDVEITVTYNNWKETDGAFFPQDITLSIGDSPLREEHISAINFNPKIDASSFAFDGEASPLDAEQQRLGKLRSQWYLRMMSFGFSQDFPLTQVDITELSSGVHLVSGGPALAYMSLIVEQADGLIYIEPNLNAQRSTAVLKAVKEKFTKPITDVLATHTHMDHFGGVRTLVSEGARLHVGKNGQSWASKVLSAPHELYPDGLTPSKAKNVEILAVDKKINIGTGSGEVQLLPLNAPHSDDMLAFYLPTQKLLFVADIFNGGFVYGWDYYTQETRKPVHERAVLLQEFIKAEALDVTQIIGVHGGIAPISELDQLVNSSIN